MNHSYRELFVQDVAQQLIESGRFESCWVPGHNTYPDDVLKIDFVLTHRFGQSKKVITFKINVKGTNTSGAARKRQRKWEKQGAYDQIYLLPVSKNSTACEIATLLLAIRRWPQHFVGPQKAQFGDNFRTLLRTLNAYIEEGELLSFTLEHDVIIVLDKAGFTRMIQLDSLKSYAFNPKAVVRNGLNESPHMGDRFSFIPPTPIEEYRKDYMQ